ncbi:GntR family transcriptional regulator [Actinocorallia aurantiaca]|uniref:HTH gntR-type domain-containing protein n=1 Tax=Actinocorallia aurantiaca TaxID=46204 RepID=A0ABN3UVU3_9ACTN
MASVGFQEIAEEIRQQIDAGRWSAGHRLPSEAALVARFGVARATVRRAFEVLEAEGIVEAVSGKGRFVRAKTNDESSREASAKYEQVAAQLRREVTESQVTEWKSSELATRFEVAPGTVRKALQMLADEGLVTAVSGRGWLVGSGSRTQEVMDAIKNSVKTGEFGVGTALPGERDLAARFGVARITVHRAIERLEEEGVLEKQQGKGRLITWQGGKTE